MFVFTHQHYIFHPSHACLLYACINFIISNIQDRWSFLPLSLSLSLEYKHISLHFVKCQNGIYTSIIIIIIQYICNRKLWKSFMQRFWSHEHMELFATIKCLKQMKDININWSHRGVSASNWRRKTGTVLSIVTERSNSHVSVQK